MEEKKQNICKICAKISCSSCSRCKIAFYCSKECQKQDWPNHKKTCSTQQAQPSEPEMQKKPKAVGDLLIDKDNLKLDESVGTFRWNNSIKLIDAPLWKDEFKELLPGLNSGWQGYVGERFQYTAKPGTTEIIVQPHQLDGLSFSMTLVRLIALIRLHKKTDLIFVIIGASAKVEERIFVQTNYYEEVTNFYPQMKLQLYIIGPELSVENNGKTVQKNKNLSATFFRGKISEFLDSIGNQTGTKNDDVQIFQQLPKEKTLFLGYNPGFGSGFEPLLQSWATDLIILLNLRFPVFFTQANDFSDLKGETRVFEVLFENKIKMILPPEENPFRAMTHYQSEEDKNNSKNGNKIWCCANTHLYGFQGWINPNDDEEKYTIKQIREKLNSQEGQMLLQELLIYSKTGGPQE